MGKSDSRIERIPQLLRACRPHLKDHVVYDAGKRCRVIEKEPDTRI